MDSKRTINEPVVDMAEIEQRIETLFRKRWTDDLANADLESMKTQLYKNLLDQVRGYWSGHTAYHLMVDGGFLVDAKSGEPKTLTQDGQAFMAQYEKAFAEDEWALVVEIITAGNQAKWDELSDLITSRHFSFYSQAQSAAIMTFKITEAMVAEYPKAAWVLSRFSNQRRWGMAEAFRQGLIEQLLEKHVA